ncbi:cyclin-dependent kinase [Trifolium pratense]|uniref:Cyclin-dependent kinase n=1 Tax=Trifolium pratense TaxID=57577 RepID=A0A2K3N786_TRIPR|nr:cyclin-dependent kinase [Trifolium pratense]
MLSISFNSVVLVWLIWPAPVTYFCTTFLLCINHRNVPFRYNLLRKKFPATSFTGSPVLSDSGLDLLNKLLTYDPEKRITAEDALNHGWFREVPLPKSKEFMPTFPAQHDKDSIKASRLRMLPVYPGIYGTLFHQAL